jgi:hypothetical protein
MARAPEADATTLARELATPRGSDPGSQAGGEGAGGGDVAVTGDVIGCFIPCGDRVTLDPPDHDIVRCSIGGVPWRQTEAREGATPRSHLGSRVGSAGDPARPCLLEGARVSARNPRNRLRKSGCARFPISLNANAVLVGRQGEQAQLASKPWTDGPGTRERRKLPLTRPQSRRTAPGWWSPPPLPARCLSTDQPRALNPAARKPLGSARSSAAPATVLEEPRIAVGASHLSADRSPLRVPGFAPRWTS